MATYTLTQIGELLLGILTVASLFGMILHRKYGSANETVHNFNMRVKAWWLMASILFLAFLLGYQITIMLFGFISLMTLREFLTLMATRKSDYWPLFIAFYIALPLQYYLLWIEWHSLFSIFIPVYIFALISAASALSQDTDDFLARNASILFAVMVCIYGISHAPALLMLNIPGFGQHNVKLLFFFIFIVQMSDVLQYIFGKLFGKHSMLPKLSPGKTWQGFIGGGLAAIGLGISLHTITPFSILEAAALSLLIVLCGVLGGLIMSAIKRSLGAKDWGTGIAGHGGYMDRFDSLWLAAPVFFYIVRWHWTP